MENQINVTQFRKQIHTKQSAYVYMSLAFDESRNSCYVKSESKSKPKFKLCKIANGVLHFLGKLVCVCVVIYLFIFLCISSEFSAN